MHWTAYLWPGLPHLWNRGSWAGLALAVGFTVLLNALVAATFIFTEWMTGTVRLTAGGLLLVLWVLAWLESRADWRRYVVELTAADTAKVDPEQQSDRMFREAQQHYLAGDWIRTEQVLLEMLHRDARDVEGRLLLATLWRHMGRTDAAREQLDRLERLEAAGLWQDEISREREQLDRHNILDIANHQQGELRTDEPEQPMAA